MRTPDHKKHRKRKIDAKYRAKPKSRVRKLLNNYQSRGGTNFTCEELLEYLEQPCFYCGTEQVVRGLDRIDNTKGHYKDNVIPACRTCNRLRSNVFTVAEALDLGSVVAYIRASRGELLPPPP